MRPKTKLSADRDGRETGGGECRNGTDFAGGNSVLAGQLPWCVAVFALFLCTGCTKKEETTTTTETSTTEAPAVVEETSTTMTTETTGATETPGVDLDVPEGELPSVTPEAPTSPQTTPRSSRGALPNPGVS